MRTLQEIAYDINTCWPIQYFGAKPYVEAMQSLLSIEDTFYQDSGREIVTRFLCNAGTWRGPDARRIKAELNKMLKDSK